MAATTTFLQRCAFISICLLALLTATAVQAQIDSTQAQTVRRQRWLIETKEGSVFQGVFLGQDEAGVHLLTESVGEVTIPSSSIKSFRIMDGANFRDGEYWFENPNATRYLFSPSAFSLKKGDAYYQNTYLVLNSFHYGITDRFTIGGGFELISTFTGSPIFFITPKYSFPISEKFRGGAGIFYVNSTISDDFAGLAVGYGLLTYGNTDKNATVGLGYGYVDDSFSKKPIITLSGMTRVARKVGLVTENWIVPIDDYYGIYSYGIRFMGEKITVDLAFLNNREIADLIFIGIPYLDFVVKFGK